MRPNKTNYYFSPLEYNERLRAVPVYTADNIPAVLGSTMCEIMEDNPNIKNRGECFYYFPIPQVCEDIEEYRKNYTEKTIPSNSNKIYTNGLNNSTTGEVQLRKGTNKKSVPIISGVLAALIIGIVSHQLYSTVNNYVNNSRLDKAITTMADIDTNNLNITHRTADNQYFFYDTDRMARNAMKSIENYLELYYASTIQRSSKLPSPREYIDLIFLSASNSMTYDPNYKNINSFYINLSISASDPEIKKILDGPYNFEDYVISCGFVNKEGKPDINAWKRNAQKYANTYAKLLSETVNLNLEDEEVVKGK